MKRIISFLFALLCLPAWATDYHLCDCQSGAHGSCVAGSNANAGTSSSAPKQTIAGYTYSSLAAGDRVLFCQGGKWASVELNMFNTNATATSPITFSDYAPPSGATGVPWLVTGASGITLRSSQFGAVMDGGYAISNLRLDGGTVGASNATYGIYLAANTRNVTIENVTIQGYGVGIYMDVASDCSENNEKVAIRNSTITRNSQGILGGAIDLLIEGNTLSKNGREASGFGLDHNIYLGGAETPGCNGRVVIRNNTLSDPGNAESGGTGCRQGNITGHGSYDQVEITGNTITNTSMASGCGGISWNPGYGGSYQEGFYRFHVHGNRLTNGNISVTAAPYALIENNRVIFDIATGEACIAMPDRASSGGGSYDTAIDEVDIGARIIHNSCYHSTPNSGAVAINTNGGAGLGSSAQVVGNLIYMASGTGSQYCFSPGSLAVYTAFNWNLCYGADAWSSVYANLAAAQAAGFDVNGLNSDPLLAATPASGNDYSMAVQSGSPARSAASNTYKPRYDTLGCRRDSTPDIGAYEYGGTPCITFGSPTFKR
jgi:hypothetical protein